FFSSFSGVDSANWVQQKNENGIVVYTREISGSVIKEVRVVNYVKSSLSGMVALLLDTKNYTNWIYECTQSRPLKVVSAQEMYNYQVTNFPWPVSDRDLICNFKISQDSATKVVSFTKTGIPEYLPTQNPYVRIRNFESDYKLTPLPNDSVKVELQMKVDPGGDIPTWLINANIVMAPFKSTVAMIPQIPKYQSASFSFIKEL
ncbi:MAG: START domain-containing protein, partial [Chitinophagales bacterium]